MVFLGGLAHVGWLVGWATEGWGRDNELRVSHPVADNPGSVHMWLDGLPNVARTEDERPLEAQVWNRHSVPSRAFCRSEQITRPRRFRR